MTAHQLLTDFTKNIGPEFKRIVQRLDEIIEGSGKRLDVAVKWRQLTYAYNTDFHHWICGISITKNTVGLNFHFGGLLDDPNGVFKSGSSMFLRKIEYRTIEDVDEGVILGFLVQALDKLEYFKENWKEIKKRKR
jgi:hypothetical protein